MSTLIQTDQSLATAHIIDACMRLKVAYRIAPFGIKPLVPITNMISGPALPVRHYGSVDIFLEVLESASHDDILVIDNHARTDEACIGDLVVLEAKQAGIQTLIVNGLHRDTAELLQIGLPVFSYGAYPSGPSRLDNREAEAFTNAQFGNFVVTKNDTVFADQDGVVFVETQHVDSVLESARAIRDKEKRQSVAAQQGLSLRDQFEFSAYLKQREKDPAYTFRQHLAMLTKSIEE